MSHVVFQKWERSWMITVILEINNFFNKWSDTKWRKITRNCYNDKTWIFYLTYVTEGNIKALSNVTNKNCPASASMKPFNFLRSTLTPGLATWYKMSTIWIPTPTKIPHSRAQNRQQKKVANAGIKSVSEKKNKVF